MSTVQTVVNGFAEVVENEYFKLEYKKVNGSDEYGTIKLTAKDTLSAFEGDIELYMATDDGLLINHNGTTLFNARVDGVYVSAPLFTSQGNVPPTSTSPGQAGEEAWDDNYFYKCIATDTWKRSDLNTF